VTSLFLNYLLQTACIDFPTQLATGRSLGQGESYTSQQSSYGEWRYEESYFFTIFI